MIIVCQHCRVASKKKKKKKKQPTLNYLCSGGWQQYWRHQVAQIKYAYYAYIKLIGLIGTIRNGRALCGQRPGAEIVGGSIDC